jgi:anaerobic ribonucleoside-triphosphate reductase activating protein
MVQHLLLSRIHFPVSALGPGRRLGIWFQGCSIRCPGCLSLDTWAPGRGRVGWSAFIAAISPWLDAATGVTISGGEPFEQPEALEKLLRFVRERSAADILVFTGYPWETLPTFVQSDTLIDALITDPYQAETSQRLALRGSDNQRLHCLTALGHARFQSYSRDRGSSDDLLDVGFDADGNAWMAGIPKRDDLKRLLDHLHRHGHTAASTLDPRAEDLGEQP